MLVRVLLGAVLAAAALLPSPATAGAAIRLPAAIAGVAGNPADALAPLPIESFRYDRAKRCAPKRRKGTEAFVAWLEGNVRGSFWGSYRCELWGEGSASLHAENRAVDWRLDATARADRAEARRLVLLLLAPDRAGNAQALARRMGVEEIIWDCGYWAQGMTRFTPYRICYTRKGRLRKRVNQTLAHRDHIHFGLTRRGSRGRTSFWTGG
jgi:hypothetical protein